MKTKVRRILLKIYYSAAGSLYQTRKETHQVYYIQVVFEHTSIQAVTPFREDRVARYHSTITALHMVPTRCAPLQVYDMTSTPASQLHATRMHTTQHAETHTTCTLGHAIKHTDATPTHHCPTPQCYNHQTCSGLTTSSGHRVARCHSLSMVVCPDPRVGRGKRHTKSSGHLIKLHEPCDKDQRQKNGIQRTRVPPLSTHRLTETQRLRPTSHQT